MRELILTGAVLLLLTPRLFAQSGTTASGGEALGSGGTVNYTTGQLNYQTHNGASGSVAEGVQQPYEISVVTGIEEVGIGLNISAYPNPTTDFLKLKVEGEKLNYPTYQLFDMHGKLLKSDNLAGYETQINMQHYESATYFVKVISEQKSIKEFKIIKN